MSDIETKRKLPRVFVGISGLPSAGKTTLGDALVRGTNLVFFDVDRASSYLFGESMRGVPIESLEPTGRIHVTQTGYMASHEWARDHLGRGKSSPVATAATYSFDGYHHMLKRTAAREGVPLVMLQLEPPRTDAEIEEILHRRQNEGNPSHLTTARMVREVEARFQHIQGVPVRVIDRQSPLSDRVGQAIEVIEEIDLQDNLPVMTLLRGSFTPDQINIREPDQANPYETVYRSEESQALIDRYRSLGKTPAQILPVFHRAWSDSQGSLQIEMLHTDLAGLGELPSYEGNFAVEAPVRDLGVSTVFKTSDEMLVLAQRLTPHPIRQGGLHLVGGYVDSSDVRGGNLDPIHALEREAWEEAGITQVDGVRAIGLSQKRRTGEVSLLFAANTSMTAEQIRSGSGDGEIALKFIPDTGRDLARILTQYGMFASTPSLAALHEYGRQNYGRDWSREVLTDLGAVFREYDELSSTQRDVRRMAMATSLRDLN